MGKKMLHNPAGEGTVREVFAVPESFQKRLEELEAQVAFERSKAPVKQVVHVDRQVEKIVYQDDPGLLQRFNVVVKENGDLKMRLNKMSQPVVAAAQVETKEVVRLIHKEVVNKWYLFGSFIAGVVSCFLLLKR